MSGPSYLTVVTEDRRLALLRVLAELPDYRAGDSVLCKALYQLGHTASRAQVLGDIQFLSELDLLDIESVAAVTVATLTQRGQDAAKGRATVPGVARPSPRA